MRTFLALLVGAAALVAQDAPAEKKQPEDPAVLLSTALRTYASADDLVVRAAIKHKPPDRGGMFGGAGIVEMKIAGSSAAPFEGNVEAWRAADGTRVIVSEKKLPGFELYLGDGRTVERITVEKKKFSLAQIKAELDAMLDQAEFARGLLAAKLKPSRDAATGKVTFRGDLSRDVVRPVTGDNMLRARVLKVGAELVVSPDGKLERAALKITRSDPLREMMRGEMKGIRVQLGGAGVPVPEPEEDDAKKHDLVGGSTTYTLTFEQPQPSDRAKAFKREAVRLIAGK